MKDKILKLIASSKNSYELADRICELIMEEKGKSAMNGARKAAEAFIDEAKPFDTTPASPEPSRRDVRKGK